MKMYNRIFLVLLAVFTIVTISGQEKKKYSAKEIIEEYKAYILENMQKKHFVGIGAAIICRDSLIWKEGFGYADKENNIPFTTGTALCIGSITKPFTALGIAKLKEEKLIDINNPLIEYLPEFNIKTRGADIKKITVKSVIQHTSGIPNDIFLNTWNENENYTSIAGYLKDEYISYPVNMIFHYSNIGYALLGHIIKNISKVDYPQYIQDKILKPAGMKNSGFLNYCSLKNISRTYDSTGVYIPLKIGRNLPSGGLHSTIDDLVIFAKEIIAVYKGKKGSFLKPETLKIFEEVNNDNVQCMNNALGWQILKNDSSLIIMHGGSHLTANAMITIDLKKEIAAVIFVNTLGGMDFASEAAGKIWELTGIKSSDMVHPYNYNDSSAISNQEKPLEQYAGIYVDTDIQRVIKYENNKLILYAEFGNCELKPAGKDEFIPGFIYSPDSIKWQNQARFVIPVINGYQLLFWQDASHKRQLLGHLVTPKEIGSVWKDRLGKYKLKENKFEGWENFSEVELSVADNNLLQLKILYRSGEYLYYLCIEKENELIRCGFGEAGGETISFGKDNQNDTMKLFGLIMIKE